MPNPSEEAPLTPKLSMSPVPMRKTTRVDKYIKDLYSLMGRIQEEHEREVNSLRRENEKLHMRLRAEGFTVEFDEVSKRADEDDDIISFTSNLTDLVGTPVRSKPRGRAPMGATKVSKQGNNHQNNFKYASDLSQPLHSPGCRATEIMRQETGGREVKEVSIIAQSENLMLGSAEPDSYQPRTGPETLFPRWFNPYVQETYIGESSKGNEINLLTQIMEKEHNGKAHRRDSCILMPIGRPRLTWDVCWCMCLIFEIWITPIDLVFVEDGMMPDSLRFAARLTMIFFFLDIVLNFFTGYMDGEKEIMNRRLIAKNYLRFWFWFDVMATVPWDEIVGQDSSTVSTSRAAKVSKAFKVMKMVKLVRLAKVFHHVENVKRVRFQRAIERVMKGHETGNRSQLEKLEEFITAMLEPLKHLAFPAQVFCFLAVISHVHAIIFATIYDWGNNPDSIEECFHRYYESFWWVFSVFTYREVPQSTSPELWTYEIFIFSERLCLTAYALLWLIFRALIWREDDARTSLKNTNAMQYLKQHHVSVKTQVQVLFSVNQCGNIQKTQRNFMDLMENDLPQELQRQICEELWSTHLASLALILAVSDWRSDFLTELSQLVREETYAGKVIVFREGDAAVASYMVLQGVLTVLSSFQSEAIPDFTKGMWLGEKALVNLGLRRSGTGLTKAVSTLMSVPAAGFQALLERMDLLGQFQQFCSDELWKGLCGRCGTMGSHFGHECPLLPQQHRPKSGAKFSIWRSGTMSGGIKGVRKRESTHLSRDIKMYLGTYGMERFIPDMEELGIENLDDLQQPENINLFLGQSDLDLTDEELKLFTPNAIMDFKQEIAGKARSLLSAKMSNTHHFMFLSHYKVEAGTEAALMRAELEQLIIADDGHPAKDLDSPIFLDSEDLQDLVDLMKAVQKSHNLILMLTKGILTRPWCIVEICTAMREGVSVLPVKITKPGSEFVFPDENFYASLLKGDILGQDGGDVVVKHGFTIEDVAESIRRVFKRIAVPYSPHRTSAIRKEELAALLRQCSCREIPDRQEAHILMQTQASEQMLGARPSISSQQGLQQGIVS